MVIARGRRPLAFRAVHQAGRLNGVFSDKRGQECCQYDQGCPEAWSSNT